MAFPQRSVSRIRRRAPEAAFHITVARYLDRALPQGFFHTCFPAGGGGYIRGAQLKARGLKPGLPDHVVFSPGDPGETLWLELKSKTGSLSAEQRRVHQILERLGHTVAVVKTLDQVEIVLAYFILPYKLCARLT